MIVCYLAYQYYLLNNLVLVCQLLLQQFREAKQPRAHLESANVKTRDQMLKAFIPTSLNP